MPTRRHFLQALGLSPWALQLTGIANAAAANVTQANDYRALVCLFLRGANDCHNTIIPYDSNEYAAYTKPRGDLALSYDSLLPLKNTSLALHPALQPLQNLFNQGSAAVLANVGPLITPIRDAASFKDPRTPRPPKLFSHNDQEAIWQAFSPEGARIGWGGKMCDLLADLNGQQRFTTISTAGNAVLLASEKIAQYQITNNGAVNINRLKAGNIYGSNAAAMALQTQLQANQNGLLSQEYSQIVNRSIEAQGLISDALNTLPESDPRVTLPEELAQDKLAQQLRMVARIIGVRQHSNMQQRRQVFFVSLGGFDTHDNQIKRQAELLDSVAQSVAWFYQATAALNIQNGVTLFTASDFGRTLVNNGDGSDHGWGGHHFIVGGAVKGGRVYGQFPEVRLGTTTDVGNGRLLPTTSVDQYAASLARWMGVAESMLPSVLPNLPNFDQGNTGFF